MASSAIRFSSRSSTSRIFALSSTRRLSDSGPASRRAATPSPTPGPTATLPARRLLSSADDGGLQPVPHDVKEMIHVDGLRHVVRRARFEALLPIALHHLRGDHDDRQLGEL